MTRQELNMINLDIYFSGSDRFDLKYGFLNDEEYAEAIEHDAWNAYYNNMYNIDSVELAYFVIAEGYSIECANEFLKEQIKYNHYDSKHIYFQD